MNKAIRFIKRLVALILVLLFSIESLAAVVSDNDGSAFITKAEFDSLKNNFQAQIDQYNTSIDNKIDGAIAGYLSGIRIAKNKILDNNYDKLNSEIRWAGSTSYLFNPNMPEFGMKVTLSQFHMSTAFSRTWTRSNFNTNMFYGYSEDATTFIVQSVRDMNPLYNISVIYFFGGYLLPANASLVSRAPSRAIIANVSFGSPNWSDFNSYSPDDNSSTKSTGWRLISTVGLYETSPVLQNYLILAPFSSNANRVYDAGERITNVKLGSTPASVNVKYSDTGWGTLSDLRSDTTVQDVDPNTIIWGDVNLTLPKIYGVDWPWIKTKYAMNKLYYENIISVTGKKYPISYGIYLCKVDETGTINTTIKPSCAGTAMFAHRMTPSDSWGSPSSPISDVYYFNCQANVDNDISFSCKAEEEIWFIYRPTNDSELGTVTFGDLNRVSV